MRKERTHCGFYGPVESSYVLKRYIESKPNQKMSSGVNSSFLPSFNGLHQGIFQCGDALVGERRDFEHGQVRRVGFA